MRDPARLDVVPASEELAMLVYAATRTFPKDKRFGLTAQMRRAAVSVGSNIVEGCHRQGDRAFIAFLYNALGSAGELEFQLRLTTRLKFGASAEVANTLAHVTTVKRMLIRLIKSLASRSEPGRG